MGKGCAICPMWCMKLGIRKFWLMYNEWTRKGTRQRSGISTLFGSQLVNGGRGRKLVIENLSNALRVNNGREIQLQILYSHSFGKWSWSCNQSLFELSSVELLWLIECAHSSYMVIPYRVVYLVAHLTIAAEPYEYWTTDFEWCKWVDRIRRTSHAFS